jgi:hypothetical protein
VGPGWLVVGLLGSAAFAACLPEVTVDETLGVGGGTETELGSALGGSAGTTGKGSSSAGAGGAAGTASMPGVSSGGAAGTGGTGATMDMAGAAGMGASSAGAGGSAGSGGAGPGAAGTSGAAGAGPPAMGRCETNQSREEACANYCNLYFDACSDFAGVYTYTDALGCTDVCNDSDWPIGDITQKGSVLCRCYHAYRALTEGQTPHCYHAAEVPSMPNGCAP